MSMNMLIYSFIFISFIKKAKKFPSKTLANIVADIKIASKLSESKNVKLKDDQAVEKTKKIDNVVITSNNRYRCEFSSLATKY